VVGELTIAFWGKNVAKKGKKGEKKTTSAPRTSFGHPLAPFCTLWPAFLKAQLAHTERTPMGDSHLGAQFHLLISASLERPVFGARHRKEVERKGASFWPRTKAQREALLIRRQAEQFKLWTVI